MPASKLYILDTNVLLHDPKCLFQFKEQDITIPMTVLEELDSIKDRKQSVAAEARHAIRVIDNILSTASNASQITKGVRILVEGKEREHKLGKLSIFPDHELTMRQGFLPDDSNKDNGDTNKHNDKTKGTNKDRNQGGNKSHDKNECKNTEKTKK